MTTQKVKLKKIFIGEIDGESEAIKRHDFENLFFNQNNNYQKLLSGESFLIKGRKGTGKTYLAKYLNLKINSSGICCCCKGIYKTCGNYIWRYAEIEKVE